MYLTVHHQAVYKVIENTITLLSLIKYLYFSLSLSFLRFKQRIQSKIESFLQNK